MDFIKFLKLFDSKIKLVENPKIIPGGFNLNIVFSTNNNTNKFISINSNKYVVMSDFSQSYYFEIIDFNNLDLTINYPNKIYYSFSTSYRYLDIYLKSFEGSWIKKDEQFKDLNSVLYIPSVKVDNEPIAYLTSTEVDKILIYSDNIFSYEELFFEVIGSVNFSSIFD